MELPNVWALMTFPGVIRASINLCLESCPVRPSQPPVAQSPHCNLHHTSQMESGGAVLVLDDESYYYRKAPARNTKRAGVKRSPP